MIDSASISAVAIVVILLCRSLSQHFLLLCDFGVTITVTLTSFSIAVTQLSDSRREVTTQIHLKKIHFDNAFTRKE